MTQKKLKRPNHDVLMKKALSDPEIKEIYDSLEEEFSLLEEFVSARHMAGLTQSDVAKVMGTKTSAIGRLESKLATQHHSPTLATLRKYARALGCHLEIHLVQNPLKH